MTMDIFKTPELLDRIAVITDAEENRYTDIPKWDGLVETYTERGVKLLLTNGTGIWFPLNQLRIAEDRQSLYASNWILEQHEKNR
jgi:hypothetical protein